MLVYKCRICGKLMYEDEGDDGICEECLYDDPVESLEELHYEMMELLFWESLFTS